MKAILIIASLSLALLASDPLFAQADDLAAERARLANQRIQVEAERRAREERERAEAEARVRAEAEASAARTQMAEELAPRAEREPALAPAVSPVSSGAKGQPGGADLSRTLEQLQKLGELRDAGYLTEEEFQRIKARILDTGL